MKTKYYDIVLSSPFSNYDFFAHRLRELCGQMGLTFFLVDDMWVKEFTQKVQADDIKVRVLFDLTANQAIDDDDYLLLAREVIKQRGTVIDDPDITVATAHKGVFHNVLKENKIPVPETIIVNRSELEDFQITREIRSKVGVPFVVKPAWGDSGVGVNIDGHYEEDLLESAEQAPNSDAFLIQKFVEPKKLGYHVGWFRMFYICGEVIPCWWNPSSHEYHLVSPQQVKRYKLAPLARIMRGIARVSKMRKFTSEICLQTDGKFVVVDYINADPDMNPRSFYDNGVPDEVVRYIVWLLFYEGMRIVKKGQGFFDQELGESEEEANWLEKRKLEQRGNR
ncbi:RimK family alpha-L-glutamate ligase [Chloroflexota bacterium]